MMRSLFSAISGLKNHQVKMDVIGNNIANVNTTGFKRSRVSFATTLSQTMKGASQPTPVSGGTNPIQIGGGAILGTINQIMTQGGTESTGIPTDMLIQGSGFFILENNGTVYSRTGTFEIDGVGNLVDPATGAKVQGAMYTDDTTTNPASMTTDMTTTPPTQPTLIPIQIVIGSAPFTTDIAATGSAALDSYTIGEDGMITGLYITPAVIDSTTGLVTTAAITETHKIGQIGIATFSNDAGLENIGNNYYRETPNSGGASVGAANSTGHGSILTGSIEMSNVDLSTEFTDMIVAQRGFQANSRVITVSDSLLEELINLKRQ